MTPHHAHEDRAHVNRDWTVVLMVFVIIVLVVTALNVRLFMRIDKGELFVVEDTDKTAVSNTIDEELLGSTLEFFVEKENRFEQLKRTTPFVPSVR